MTQLTDESVTILMIVNYVSHLVSNKTIKLWTGATIVKFVLKVELMKKP